MRGHILDVLSFVSKEYSLDIDLMRAKIMVNYPDIKNKNKCPNCDASMAIREYRVSVYTMLLLTAMARQVGKNMREKGLDFTDANLVHITTEIGDPNIVNHSTTAHYLGFVTQPDKKKNSGMWAITSWGWKALQGELVHEAVNVYRGEILSRSSKFTTLSDVCVSHTKRKRVRKETDWRHEIERYDPSEWAKVVAYQQGKLL